MAVPIGWHGGIMHRSVHLPRKLIWAAGVWALTATTSFAADPRPIATAPPVVAAPAASTTDDTAAQIAAWGREDDDGDVELGNGAEPDQPRRVHGEVTVGAGTGGFAGVSGVADVPVGQNSDLVVAGSRSTFGSHGFRGNEQSLSVGLFLNGAKPALPNCRPPAIAYGGPYGGWPPFGLQGNGYAACQAPAAGADPTY